MNRLLSQMAVVVFLPLFGCTVSQQEYGSQSFELTECPAGSPDGLLCPQSLPFTDSNTSSDGGSVLDGYDCAPDNDESGPEKVYRVELAEEGLLVASLDNLGAGVDVDVHILEQLDAGTCVDRGHWDAAALLPAGEYFIVVDSYVDGSAVTRDGSYELTVAVTSADDHASDSLDSTVLDAGLRAFNRAWVNRETTELEYGIIDYTMRSTKRRFFLLDLRQGELLRAELAAHGSGSQDPSDMTKTGSMSNVTNSHASSVGLVRAAETYSGSKGLSLRLDGLEPGFNSNDRSRYIVVHKANYATQSYINSHGYLGRSWGCPAVPPSARDEVLDTLKGGRLLLKYFDDADWLANSAYVSH